MGSESSVGLIAELSGASALVQDKSERQLHRSFEDTDTSGVRLELVDIHRFKSGIVKHTYAVRQSINERCASLPTRWHSALIERLFGE